MMLCQLWQNIMVVGNTSREGTRDVFQVGITSREASPHVTPASGMFKKHLTNIVGLSEKRPYFVMRLNLNLQIP